MLIDRTRVQAILRAKHTYYGSGNVPIRRDGRWYPFHTDQFRNQLTPSSRVLDVGCGNGEILLELSACYHAAVGVDNDPEHIKMAEEARRAQDANNVEFLLMDFPGESPQLEPGSFDLVFSLRGPLADSDQNIRAALDLLCHEGLIYCEEIGERHDHEVRAIFEPATGAPTAVPKALQLKNMLERNGVDVRLVADIYTKWLYPDVYAWLQYQCNIWTWLGRPLPKPNDPRIGLFADRHTIATGEIETTHHVVTVAGIKAL